MILCILHTFSALTFGHAEPKELFTSSNPTINQKLNTKFSGSTYQKLDDVDLQIEAKKFLKRRAFYSHEIKPLPQGRKFEITDPIKWTIKIVGNFTIPDIKIKESLKTKDLSGGESHFLDEVQNTIRKKYQALGFHFVDVKLGEILNTGPFSKEVRFSVKENQRVKISAINFKGDLGSFKAKKLKALLKKYSGNPVSKGYLSLSSLETGLQSLLNDLYNQGFFKAQILLDKLTFSKDRKSVKVNMTTKVGDPTKISGIEFIGNKQVSTFWLEVLLGVEPSKTIDLYKLEKGVDIIKDYYAQRGFLDSSLDDSDILKFSEDLSEVKIVIPIIEKSQILVSKISVDGLTKTSAEVVLRELVFKKGEVLTYEKYDQSRRNLRNLGIFTKVNLEVRPQKNNQFGREIKISLEEKKPGTFTTGVGISNEQSFTLKTFVGVNYSNLKGKGREIDSRIELRVNQEEQDFLENRVFLSFIEPYLFGSKLRGRVSGERTEEIFDVNDANDTVTIIESLKYNLSIERIYNKITLAWKILSFDLRQEREIEDKFDEIDEIIGSFGPSVIFDFRDNKFFPTKGFLSRFDAEYASSGLGSRTESSLGNFSLDYYKVQGLFTFYKVLAPNLIWAQSVRGGYLKNLSDGPFGIFPKSRAFFLGGVSTIRGFDPSEDVERIPNDNDVDILGTSSILGGGLLAIPEGSYFYLSKTELRFPLDRKSNIWGAIFYDGGSVQIEQGSQEIDPWRHSAGFGVRWNLPVGAINLELGYKLDRRSEVGEQPFEFHISIGTF